MSHRANTVCQNGPPASLVDSVNAVSIEVVDEQAHVQEVYAFLVPPCVLHMLYKNTECSPLHVHSLGYLRAAGRSGPLHDIYQKASL